MCGIATLFSILAIFRCIINGLARGADVRAGVLFKKMLSLSQSPIYRAFQPLFWLLTFHKRFTPGSCESDVKRLRPFAPAGNAREPLFTGTFSIGCECESIFLKSVF